VRGAARSCALKANGSVACWGDISYDSSGKVAARNQLVPTLIAGLTDTAALSAGGTHNCALKAGGAIVCWGNDFYGQLGDGTTGGVKTNLVEVIGLADTMELSSGGSHTCVRKTDGTVVCWGYNIYGQLGNPNLTSLNQVTPTVVIGLTDTVQLSAGGYHTCARKTDGSVVCWGKNDSGQLGNTNLVSSQASPTAVIGLTDAVELSAGQDHTCARKADSSVVCWGQNLDGQLGNPNLVFSQATPTAVIGLTGVRQLSAGAGHTCAVKMDNSVVCWGFNTNGELGNNNFAPSQATPTAVIGLTNVALLSAGHGSHTCALRTDASVFCWGYNANGELGDPNVTQSQGTPTVVIGLTDTTALSAGGVHTCVRKIGGSVACWGVNGVGQILGDPNLVLPSQATPTTVIGLTDIVALSGGGLYSCARKTNASVVCWGDNSNGQLGGITTIDISIKPRPIAVLGGAIFWK
jgi:alpha-tubulin suppressor-like RCC1 family protein